jgi:beta-lactamase class D
MTHEEARELLLDLAYGELETGDRRKLEEHVAGCAECEAELAGILRTRAAAGRLPDPVVPGRRAELVEAARLAVAKPVAQRRSRWSRATPWIAAAATVAVVGGVTLRWLGETPRKAASEDRVVAIAPAAPAPAERPARAEAPPAPAAARSTDALASREKAELKGERLAAAGASSVSPSESPLPPSAKRREAAVPPSASAAFVSMDLESGASFRVNSAGCATRHSPFSTFEIPARLIALETGEGEPRMKQWLATFDYGNQDVSGGLDRFWMGSTLRITPDEQVVFLARLQRGQFPVAKKNLELVQATLARDSGPGWRLVAKTGSSSTGEGWLVGWVEVEGGGCAFALHLDASSQDGLTPVLPGMARDFLRQSGCIPP